MRFVNTSTRKFHEFSDSEVQGLHNGYCILSHRWIWGSDEIQYVDVLSMNKKVKSKGGYAKFIGACELARKLGYDFIWIDTCCINKTDLVELSEAINSMYRWYSKSSLCVAYLEDVSSEDTFTNSEWFQRGWTLQELIAPQSVNFYTQHWEKVGDRISRRRAIHERTNIPIEVLDHSMPLRNCSVAQRMSWAARRTTTRLEDRAYSLMGLFDVNMPLIYGEREKAFIRLQELIIAKLPDESIFAWDLDYSKYTNGNSEQMNYGLLALTPAAFIRSGDVVVSGKSRGFHIDQFGLRITLPATIETLGTYQATLNAKRIGIPGKYTIFLAELSERDGSWGRVKSLSNKGTAITETLADQMVDFCVPMEIKDPPPVLFHGFKLEAISQQARGEGFAATTITMWSDTTCGDKSNFFMLPRGRTGTAGIIRIDPREESSVRSGWIKLGFTSSFRPVCYITFPPIGEKGSEQMLRQSDELLARIPATEHLESQLRLGYGTPERLNHEFFDGSWTLERSIQSLSELPHYCFDSRTMQRTFDGGFNCLIDAPFCTIQVNATLVPKSFNTGTNKQDVWVMTINFWHRPRQ